jgi:hypothetical protein
LVQVEQVDQLLATMVRKVQIAYLVRTHQLAEVEEGLLELHQEREEMADRAEVEEEIHLELRLQLLVLVMRDHILQ